MSNMGKYNIVIIPDELHKRNMNNSDKQFYTG